MNTLLVVPYDFANIYCSEPCIYLVGQQQQPQVMHVILHCRRCQ